MESFVRYLGTPRSLSWVFVFRDPGNFLAGLIVIGDVPATQFLLHLRSWLGSSGFAVSIGNNLRRSAFLTSRLHFRVSRASIRGIPMTEAGHAFPA